MVAGRRVDGVEGGCEVIGMATQYDIFKKRVKAIRTPDNDMYDIRAILDGDYGWNPKPTFSMKVINPEYSLGVTEDLRIMLLRSKNTIDIDDSDLPDEDAIKLNLALDEIEAAIHKAEMAHLNSPGI